MDLFTLAAKLTLDKSEYEQGLRDSKSDAEGFGVTIGNALVTAGKVGAAGLGIAATAVGALALNATQTYAEYEQLVGGVETLFGRGGQSLEEYAASVGKTTEEAEADFNNYMHAQETVLANADRAFDTAGMSANEYMETVTGFAASLIQSMNGDTLAAAEKADMAITDMSDNANKMGTSMESIQNAYSGFAKQNYTMLDNLKLGYGGTKEEMERLLTDAQNLKAAQGEYVEYSIDSYADVVDAIHVVQTELGITGTTAKEGATTIEGSGKRMKAAWQNVVTNFKKGGSELNTSIQSFLESAQTYVGNVLPVVEEAISGIAQFLEKALPELLQMALPMIQEFLPKLLNAAVGLVKSVIGVLPEALQGILPILSALIQSIGDAFPEEIKKYILPAFGSITAFLDDVFKGDWLVAWEELKNIFHNAFDGVGQFLADTFNAAKDLVMEIDWAGVGEFIWGAITNVFATIVDWATTIFTSAAEAIREIDWKALGQQVWDWIAEAFSNIVGWFTGAFTDSKDGVEGIDWVGLGLSIFDYIVSAFAGIVDFYVGIFSNAWDAISQIDWLALGTTIWDTIISAFNYVGEWAIEKFTFLGDMIKSIDWLAVGNTMWDTIITAFNNVAGWAIEVFELLAQTIKDVNWLAVGEKIWELIKSGVTQVLEWGKTVAHTISEGVKGIDWGAVGAAIWKAFKDGVTQILEWGKAVAYTIGNGIKLIDWKEVGSTVWGFLKDGFEKILEWGEDVAGDIVEGITTTNWVKVGSDIWEAIKGAFATVTDFFAGIFDFSGIHIKFPHFEVTQWADFGPISVPWSWDVVWYAKGYDNPLLFDSPGILGGYGFGDRGAYQGGEMLYSHDRLMDDIREATGGNRFGDVSINIYQQPGEDNEDLAQRINQILNDDYSRWEAMYT